MQNDVGILPRPGLALLIQKVQTAVIRIHSGGGQKVVPVGRAAAKVFDEGDAHRLQISLGLQHIQAGDLLAIFITEPHIAAAALGGVGVTAGIHALHALRLQQQLARFLIGAAVGADGQVNDIAVGITGGIHNGTDTVGVAGEAICHAKAHRIMGTERTGGKGGNAAVTAPGGQMERAVNKIPHIHLHGTEGDQGKAIHAALQIHQIAPAGVGKHIGRAAAGIYSGGHAAA